MAGQEKFDGNFEKAWKDALDGMQETPPPSVWNEIDRQLTYEELAVYKSKVLYYKWSAAAVLFLAAFSVLMVLLLGDEKAAGSKFAESVNIDRPEERFYNLHIPVLSSDEEAVDAGDPPNNEKAVSPVAFHSLIAIEEDPSKAVDMSVFHEFEVEKMNPRTMVAANYEDKEIFKVATYDFRIDQRKKNNNDRYWAGVGLSRGTFDPNFQSEGNTLSDATQPASFSLANNEAVDRNAPDVREGMTSGGTMALGLNFGFKVGNRWTLESGVQYARADATTTTNVVIETTTIREVIPASSEVKSMPQVQRAISDETVIEYDYKDVDMANEFQFATIPVKAGYLLIDSKFKFEVNAGVAANVYLGNKLTAQDDQLANVTFGPGDTSPYRELSFSGLAGVQIGYEFFDNFDLIVEPNYRRSINSLTKDNSAFTTNPSGFGVMTGVRYRFE